MKLNAIASRCLELSTSRILVAIAGPPASGKSTLSQQLAEAINELSAEPCAVVLPMDGFHLDNALLDHDQTRNRKGAVHTFDFDGFHHILQRAAVPESEVVIPRFDRTLDLARAGATRVTRSHRIVLVEGNYLLLNEPPWRSLTALFQYRIFLDIAEATLLARLQQRWSEHGHTAEQAMARAQSNDLPNARQVLGKQLAADLVLTDW
jgi:pantothenate kinase